MYSWEQRIGANGFLMICSLDGFTFKLLQRVSSGAQVHKLIIIIICLTFIRDFDFNWFYTSQQQQSFNLYIQLQLYDFLSIGQPESISRR